MKFRFGIKTQFLANIAIIVLVTFLAFNFMFRQIAERDSLLSLITENYQPSLTKLSDLRDKFEETGKIALFWSLNTSDPGNTFRDEFNLLFTGELPVIQDELIEMSFSWVYEDQELLIQTLQLITDSLYNSYINFISEVKYSSFEGDLLVENSSNIMADMGIIFLVSEIEQNINFLSGKRQLELESINAEISNNTKRLKSLIILFSILLSLLIIIFILIIFRQLNKKIFLLSKNLEELGHGIIPEAMQNDENSEFSILIHSLNKLFDYMKNLSLVARRIEEKDFNVDFQPLSANDELGNSIVNLRESLKKAHKEQEKNKAEEDMRNWTSSSVGALNDLLRISTDKIEDLANVIIKTLVELTDSKVGGLFLLNDDNKDNIYIESIAAYAYDREKALNKTILPGEGLIGRCMNEKETIYLTDVPKDYLTIKSGLGEDSPLCILLVPLHLNDSIFGVVEIASFKEIEKYKIDFVENIGENIAMTISKLKTNIQTSLLFEQTKQQAQELLKQEEGMRRSMEELRITQEESAKREKILQKEIDDLNLKLKNKLS